MRFGNGKGYQSLAYITVSTGIGCGLVLQEKIYTGEHGWAGEIGHTTAVYNGAICTCGKSGCLQAEASGKAIARKWLEKANVNYKNIDGSFVAAQAASGDILARDIFKEAATLVGISIANLINLIDIEVVIIGGGVTKAGELFFAPLQAVVNKETANIPSRKVSIISSILGELAGVMGAIAIAQQKKSISFS